MTDRKIDSVYGYLTPKRILSSLMNPNNKSKVNKSLTESAGSPNNANKSINLQNQSPQMEKQSYRKKEKPYQAVVSSEVETDNFIMDNKSNFNNKRNRRDYPNNSSAPYINPIQTQNIGEQINGRFVPSSERNDHFNHEQGSRISRNSRESGRAKPRSQRQQNEDHSYDNYQGNMSQSSNRKYNGNKYNPEINKIAMKQVINKLIAIKCSIEQEISELKGLLDDISDNFQNMDKQFEKIKQAIILYTSRSLDSAFVQYKKALPNWNIYENTEQKGLRKIVQINQAIEICGNEQKLKMFGGRQLIEKKMDQYKLIVQQIKDAKNQCYQQRPFISQQKIKKFQAVLKQLGQF